MRISRYISALWLISLVLTTQAQESKEQAIPPSPLFCGAAVYADLAGPIMKAVGTRFNQLEAGARFNFLDRYFPLVEMGLGESDREGQKNENHFHTRAPYFRLGMDYNLNKKHNGNRFMAGLRYGFSSFKYDFTDPNYADPVWPQAATGFSLTDQQGRAHWAELSLGCETKLWAFVRMGWNFRFKARLHQHASPYGEPYYTPGFGKNGKTVFGGTMNLIFDVGRTSKKLNKK